MNLDYTSEYAFKYFQNQTFPSPTYKTSVLSDIQKFHTKRINILHT